ncbi:hypothetical protein HYDPIDRAFT_26590 [Hydnomerulius pinastri MD-312]|nr:hypothetical protein HYDPIDRAFT_26590 [Hydnomerulius pinastri MD-312]
MWIAKLLIFFSFASAILAVALPGIPTAVYGAGAIYDRDVLDLLGGGDTSGQSTPPSSAGYSPSTHATYPGLKGFGGMLVTQSTESTAPGSAAEGSHTSVATSSVEATNLAADKVTATPGPTALPVITAAAQASDHASKTWQIIGIAIIAVLFIAASITCAMFFDRLWRFAQEVICCKARSVGSEDFVPDWEKQSWETRTLSPSPSDVVTTEAKGGLTTSEDAYVYNTQPRELPWNVDIQQWNALQRQPSRRSGHGVTDIA